MSQNDRAHTPEGTVLQIIRMSTEDGPGIRTTVFLKGCPLKCAWCQNPESISPLPQLQWIGSRCIGCKTCLEVCPNGALSWTREGIEIDRSLCKGCGTCAEECPSTALELLGRKWLVASLVGEVEKDRAYFEKSGGGMTVSGGEPTMQAHFVGPLLKACQEKGLQTALDTCGYFSEDVFLKLIPFADMVLFDLKEIDPERHAAFTGHGNKKIFENLLSLRNQMEKRGQPRRLWIRTPIIPDATARDDNIYGIGRFIRENLVDMVSRWDLCSFNNLCRDKYIRLGMNWSFKDHDLLSRETMEHFARVARESGVPPQMVHWSGSTEINGNDAEPED